MPVGVSTAVANNALGQLLNGVAWGGFSTIFAQLHTGQPGPNGSTSIAAESTRQSCGAAPAFQIPANGQTTNNNLILWTNVIGSETYAFCTLWSALTGGQFIASGTLTAQAILQGNNFSIPAGGLVIAIPVAS